MGNDGGEKIGGGGDPRRVRHLPTALSRLVVEQAPFGLVLVDGDGAIQWANTAFLALFGAVKGELRGRPIGDLIRRTGSETVFQADWGSLGGGWEPMHLAIDDDDAGLLLVSVTSVERDPGTRLRLMSVIDPGESPSTALTERSRRLSVRLPSAWLFGDRLEHALDRASRSEGRVGLLRLRLDRYESLRDNLGAERLEALVDRVEERLAATLRLEDSIARLRPGGWGVLIEPPLFPGGLQATVLRCLEAMEPPFQLDEVPLLLTLSAGVAIYPEDGESPSRLLASAEEALGRAAPGRHAFFDDVLRRHLDNELAFRQRLQESLVHPEADFQLLFQPLFDLSDERCVCVGLEALVRWHHPRYGLMSPGDFLPVVEELGQKVRLDRWVLSAVIAQRAVWQAEASPLAALPISVNASGDLLRQAAFDRRPLDVFFRQHELEPGWLSLELSQQALAEQAEAESHLLRRLARQGVGLIANDVGAAPLDLVTLVNLPIPRVKLRPALAGLPGHSRVLEAQLKCLKALDLEAVLVGVESAEQLEAARAAGISLVQGHLLSEPLTPVDLEAWWGEGAAIS